MTQGEQMETLVDIAPVLAAILIAVFSPVITVKLTLKRFRQEKWWEKKADAYTRVIEALHHSKKYSEDHLDAEALHRELSEERKKELSDKLKTAIEEIQRLSDVGVFLFSKEAVVRLAQLRKEENEARNAETYFDHLDMGYGAVNSCLKDMVVIAKKDLNV